MKINYCASSLATELRRSNYACAYTKLKMSWQAHGDAMAAYLKVHSAGYTNLVSQEQYSTTTIHTPVTTSIQLTPREIGTTTPGRYYKLIIVLIARAP